MAVDPNSIGQQPQLEASVPSSRMLRLPWMASPDWQACGVDHELLIPSGKRVLLSDPVARQVRTAAKKRAGNIQKTRDCSLSQLKMDRRREAV